jgi:hypothetical protein
LRRNLNNPSLTRKRRLLGRPSRSEAGWQAGGDERGGGQRAREGEWRSSHEAIAEAGRVLENGLVMILQLFADDSQSGDFYTVAGYVGPIAEWKEFSPKWHAVLKQRPRLGFYKTSDAVNLKGQFSGWDASVRDRRVAALAAVIPRRNTCGVAAHLSKRDFTEFFTPNFLPVWDDPYYVCATYLIEKTCLMLRIGGNRVTRLDFIFDRQGKVGKNFRIVYEAMLRPMSFVLFPFMGTVSHENKTEFLPLQAADMHAGWVRRNKYTIQLWTAADVHLERIEQREFPVRRKFLEGLAQYRKNTPRR